MIVLLVVAILVICIIVFESKRGKLILKSEKIPPILDNIIEWIVLVAVVLVLIELIGSLQPTECYFKKQIDLLPLYNDSESKIFLGVGVVEDFVTYCVADKNGLSVYRNLSRNLSPQIKVFQDRSPRESVLYVYALKFKNPYGWIWGVCTPSEKYEFHIPENGIKLGVCSVGCLRWLYFDQRIFISLVWFAG